MTPSLGHWNLQVSAPSGWRESFPEKNRKSLSKLFRKKTNWDLFVIQLLLKILEISGFRVYLRRSYRNQFKLGDSDLDKLANDLAAVWWNRGAITDPDGIDEFVHCFLNVTANSPLEAEKMFQKFVTTSGIYRGIFDLKKNGHSA